MSNRYYEIGKEFYLIKSKEEDFHRNIYLKRFVSGRQTINMLMDPGTKLDIASLMDVLRALIGGIQNVDMVFLSHQDPDVTSNCNAILTAARKAVVVASIDTWRLIQMYGISEKRFLSIEKLGFGRIHLKRTGHRIQFVPARFCHFRGAMMVYDLESKILFSGDFLAGVNSRKGAGVTATADSWSGISTFHQLYMPSKEAIHEAVKRIGRLVPLPLVIAPQHGDILTGHLVNDFLVKIVGLDVGVELKKSLEPERHLILSAINQFLDSLRTLYPEYHAEFLKLAQKGGDFTSPLTIRGNQVTGISLKSDEALLYIWDIVCKIIPDDLAAEVKTHFVVTLDSLNLLVPEQLQETAEAFNVDLF